MLSSSRGTQATWRSLFIVTERLPRYALNDVLTVCSDTISEPPDGASFFYVWEMPSSPVFTNTFLLQGFQGKTVCFGLGFVVLASACLGYSELALFFACDIFCDSLLCFYFLM